MYTTLMRFLSSDEQSGLESSVFNIAIATIFAREFLEGIVIIGNYRTAINKSEHWKNPEEKKKALREVTKSAAFAALVAILIVVVVAVILGLLATELDDRVVEIIEGVSKIVAAVCILQLSLKIPTWLGLYEKVSILPCRKKVTTFANHSLEEHAEKEVMTLKEIRFNVAWNIWREVAECGIFLIPFFLDGSIKAIPISALVGIAIAGFLGLLLYIATRFMKSKFWLALIMTTLTMFLSIGLFTGGAHEFEEVLGETPDVYVIENPFWSSKSLPMAILKPFGYSSSRTVLQIVCFWTWTVFGTLLHFLKYRSTKKYRELREAAKNEKTYKASETSLDEETGDVKIEPSEEQELK